MGGKGDEDKNKHTERELLEASLKWCSSRVYHLSVPQ